MLTWSRGKRVGYCLSEKKRKKLNFQGFADLCRKHGIEVVQIDLNESISAQGPFHLIIHKLSDLMMEADHDIQSRLLVQNLENYVTAHPHLILLDPLPAIRKLLDRFESYKLIQSLQHQACLTDDRICSPPYLELEVSDRSKLLRRISEQKLTFPFICKRRVAHGSSSHEMALIFNEEGLKDVSPPCVMQSFINHDAVLYKLFVIGSSYFLVERPSLKNFPSGKSDRETIFFNSHDVSKPESCSHLTALDKAAGFPSPPPDEVIHTMVQGLRSRLGMSLFGVDVIVNNQTGKHAVIDINIFPGYEGVPEFLSVLLNHIETLLQDHEQASKAGASPVNPSQQPQPRLALEEAEERAQER
uniref:Inositol-tetrakisphosphate 1-kinase n=1 Tax=Latimeria chalumnae TaxID=7897 RepID=H3BG63_LATCH